MQNESYSEGVLDGIAGHPFSEREKDRDYVDGYAEGLLRYQLFISSTVCHVGRTLDQLPGAELLLATREVTLGQSRATSVAGEWRSLD